MATTPTPPSSLAPTRPAVGSANPREITLVSHSMLFYWWPIWLLGYIMALVTYFEDSRLAIVPADAKVTLQRGQEPGIVAYTIKARETEQEAAEAAKATAKTVRPNTLEAAVRTTETPGEGDAFKTRVSKKTWLGPLFCVVLLLTVIITNVPLRGLWSFLVLLLLLVISLGISLVPNGWDSLLSTVGHLHVYINMAGYLFIATTVLVLWAVSTFIFDTRTYMRVTPGQIAVCEHIGASVRNIDGSRVELEKKRDDMFRHWILGFFSGDLVIRLTDTKEEIRLPNVLLIGKRIDAVQRLIREKQVVAGLAHG